MQDPKYLKYLEEGKLPCVYTVCKAINPDDPWKYLLVLDITETAVFGLLFNHDNSFRCVGYFNLEEFETKWGWDKHEDEFGSTHNNLDYMYIGDSMFKLKLEVREDV